MAGNLAACLRGGPQGIEEELMAGAKEDAVVRIASVQGLRTQRSLKRWGMVAAFQNACKSQDHTWRPAVLMQKKPCAKVIGHLPCAPVIWNKHPYWKKTATLKLRGRLHSGVDRPCGLCGEFGNVACSRKLLGGNRGFLDADKGVQSMRPPGNDRLENVSCLQLRGRGNVVVVPRVTGMGITLHLCRN